MGVWGFRGLGGVGFGVEWRVGLRVEGYALARRLSSTLDDHV